MAIAYVVALYILGYEYRYAYICPEVFMVYILLFKNQVIYLRVKHNVKTHIDSITIVTFCKALIKRAVVDFLNQCLPWKHASKCFTTILCS